MRKLLAAIAITATFAGVGSASVQTYPSRPITIVVPFPAGGPTDALAVAARAQPSGRTYRVGFRWCCSGFGTFGPWLVALAAMSRK